MRWSRGSVSSWTARGVRFARARRLACSTRARKHLSRSAGESERHATTSTVSSGKEARARTSTPMPARVDPAEAATLAGRRRGGRAACGRADARGRGGDRGEDLVAADGRCRDALAGGDARGHVGSARVQEVLRDGLEANKRAAEGARRSATGRARRRRRGACRRRRAPAHPPPFSGNATFARSAGTRGARSETRAGGTLPARRRTSRRRLERDGEGRVGRGDHALGRSDADDIIPDQDERFSRDRSRFARYYSARRR